MKVLVTGSNGMVGRCLQDQVQSQSQSQSQSQITWVWLHGRKQCDLTDMEQVKQTFQEHKPDVVIHLAAAVGGLFLNQKQNAKMLRDNLLINSNVIDCCYHYGINRAIFVLSSCIYPHNPSKFPMDEIMIDEGPCHPSNEGYAYAKRTMWAMVKHYRQDYGVDYRCLIPVNLYGPYDTFDQDSGHVIPGMMMRFHKGDYTCRGTGTPLRQFLYAPDFARIILLTLNDPESPPDMICAGEELTIKEVACMISEVTGSHSELLMFQPEYSDGCMRKTVTDQLFRSTYPDFKYTPLKHGLSETYRWYQQKMMNKSYQ